ncbi:MAG TPA: SemiSWEET transporter [Bacteroidia bacterium]|nr:SemiSWEET transporter [Bacteroidia bacterium]HRG52931.1 SemiSWEET transporter [Bacteroidia bacterium]
MNFVTILGFLAAIGTTGSFIPQVIHIVKTKDTKGISLSMYIIFTSGVLCWLLYGCFLGSPPIIVANAVTLILAITILILKIKWG